MAVYMCKNLCLFCLSGMDRIVRMWNPYVSAKPVALLRGHNAPIFYLFIAPEENRVFSISTDKCVKVSMITLELSSRLLGIPNDAYMLLSQILIGCS